MNTCPLCNEPDPTPICGCGKCPPLILGPGSLVLCRHCELLIVYQADGTFIPATREQREEAFRDVMGALIAAVMTPTSTPFFGSN